MGQEKEHNETKQKGPFLKENGQKKRKRKGQGQEEKGQRKTREARTSGVFRLTKASDKWYIATKNEQGKFVHVVSVYRQNCPRYAAIAQYMFDHLPSHPSTTQEEAIAMRDRQMQLFGLAHG